MWQPRKFTPSWSKSQWVRWASNRWPNESISRFKKMKVNQIIAMYHSL
jgi:hypothetical protein